MEVKPMYELIIAMGIPSTATGLLVWWLKRYIDKKEKERQDRMDKLEELIILVMQTSRANNVLATATARAVQRIPEAGCNGDMTSALAEASKLHKIEKEFFYRQGIENIIGS